MFIDSLVVIVQDVFLKSKLVYHKDAKIDDVCGWSPKHVSSTNNSNQYYISMNFQILRTPSHSRDFKEKFKLWHDNFRLLKFILWTYFS